MSRAAELAARAFERESPLIKIIKEGSKRRRDEAESRQKKADAYHGVVLSFHTWIPRLEEMHDFLVEHDLADTKTGKKFLRTANEMRDVATKARRIIDG